MENVVLNAWYPAVWRREVTAGGLLARQLLDEPLVFWRDGKGHPVALSDRCPHRFAPLSMGRIVEGGHELECAYHGLRFRADGQCSFNPHGDGAIPKAARVRSYPVVERDSMVWIWMGDPALADPSTIPSFEFNDPDHAAVGMGHMVVDGHYELETDNILDLSHIEFLHPLFSSPAVRRAQVECEQQGDTVWSKRFMAADTDPPDFLRAHFGVPQGPMDRWLNVRWDAPASMALFAGGCPAGTDQAEAFVTKQAHCFTPESAHRTHYFYSTSVPLSAGEAAQAMADEQLEQMRGPFEREDRPVIEAVQRRMGNADLWALKPVLLPGDAAGVRARRILQARISNEARAVSGGSPEPRSVR